MKVQIVVTDHRSRLVPTHPLVLGVLLTQHPFTAYVLQNPQISGHGNTEEEALESVRSVLIGKTMRFDSRKIVEVDVADEMLVHDVMEG